MSPTSRFLTCAMIWLLMSVLSVPFPDSTQWIIVIACVALVIIVLDGIFVFLTKKPKIERQLPTRFAVGSEDLVRITIWNPLEKQLVLGFFDGIPNHAQAKTLPWSGKIAAKSIAKIAYPITLQKRGEVEFTQLHIRMLSPLGFWWRFYRDLKCETVKVYPNYEPVIRCSLLAMQHRENAIGLVHRARHGNSQEFHQLRDYQEGDPLTRIDWKSTARRQVLISRDFQEQRNQTLVFLLDTGRRMRVIDGDLPQFDHVLNAILLVAHVALSQGDQVAIQSFGGTNRWLPPLKGKFAMPQLLNHLYDYQTQPSPSDFTQAVESVMARQRRRAMVLLITNLRSEDGHQLVPALQVLSSKHLVMLASLREQVLEDHLKQSIDSSSKALSYLAAVRSHQERGEILSVLKAHGVLTLDTTSSQFAISLANQYKQIKAAGKI
ncbi:MAG: DUF58 domain-containing protein [Verrucomicrobia bacterium]|nr:MAG: DUF58 domain-containing protein [Verrucomicrobiota bacterium]